MADFEGLNGSFAERLKAMMAEAPGHVGMISGFRSRDQQQQLWDMSAKDGKMVAKPGSSHHESGSAADLKFADDATKQWVHANAARFGLFFPMSWETWHIEPAGGDKNPEAYTQPPDGMPVEDRTLNLIDIILGKRSAGADTGAQSATTQPVAPAAATTGVDRSTSGSVDQSSAYDLIIEQGGTPEEASFLSRVAGPESGYNPQAHNPNAKTGDNSYGLWQINMLGKMGEQRAKTWGLSSYEDLFDPKVNARAALDIYRSQGQNAWRNSLPKMARS